MDRRILQGDHHGDHIWSTSAFDPGSKMARWTSLVSENMTEMRVNSDQPRHFSAFWRQYGLGPLQLNFIDAAPQRCLRSPQMVSRGDEQTYELVLMRAGTMIVSYEHEREYVPEGSFTLLRNAEAYEFLCDGDSRALTAHFSDRWLRRWLVSHENFTLVPHEIRRAWGGPLAALLTAIADNGLEDAVLPRPVIADQVGALFALMSRHEGNAATRHRRGLIARIRHIMRESLEEPGLDPATLARRVGISRRYLHGLLAGSGTTFGRELVEMRLERARHMLEDPRNWGRSIAEIGFACGFSEQSHFARRFRLRFGASPSAYRRTAGRD